MAKKVYLSPSNQNKNTYAYGNTTEDVQCGKIAVACKSALERNGIEVKIGQYDTMQNRCIESNNFGADLHVPIHTNAYNGKVIGTRVFCINNRGECYNAAKEIFSELAPFTPGKSDALQINTSLYELRVPKAPSVYVECEFHDSVNAAKWIIGHTTEIGETIAKGICKYFRIEFDAPKSTTTLNPKSIDEIAKEVIQGKWGNGAIRISKLTKAGYDAKAVQTRVNELLGKTTSKPTTTLKSSDEIAKEVIRGKWGNGAARTSKLTKAGYDAKAVQARVNEMLKKG